MAETMKPSKDSAKAGTLGRRLLWFVGLWGAGVLTITIVGYTLRILFFSA
tara:strand:+ start:139178 stop:139327 length:150 start_codon:yes stop_codon:yes gene_type:complete